MKNKIFLLLLGWWFIGVVTAQQSLNPVREGKLTGVIIDESTGNPIEYASVGIFKQTDSSLITGGITNNEGRFVLDNLPYGKYYIEATFIGYEKMSLGNVAITPGQKTVDLGMLKIKSIVTKLEEVKIISEKDRIQYQLDKKVVYVTADLTAAGGTAVDALENTPSVQVDIEGNVTLRGSSNFQVLIDGKPTVLEGSEALEQIPASSIHSIEIITNPSARYDPDGLAGIINIVLKKQKQEGVNGVINFTTGNVTVLGGDFLLNYNTGKINFFVGADYNDRRMRMIGYTERETYQEDTTLYRVFDEDRTRNPKGYVLKGGMDYYIDTRNTLSISGNYGMRGFGSGSESKYHEYTLPITTDRYSLEDNNFSVERNYYQATANYQHKFNETGHEIIIMGVYSYFLGENSEDYKEYITDENWQIIEPVPVNFRNSDASTSQRYRLNIDYTNPFSEKGKLEAGYLLRYMTSISDFIYEENLGNNDWISIDTLTNSLDFVNYIQGGYTTFSNELWGIGFQFGLRTEYTNRNITQMNTGESYIIDRLDWFPTVHISKQLPWEQQVQASYSRRISRPRPWDLNPFMSYSDPYNVHVGNPELEPEYVNSYELNYQKKFKEGFFSLETFYRQTENMITRVQQPLNEKVILHTMTNLDQDYSIGIEGMWNMSLYKWWNINWTGTFYRYHLDGVVSDSSVSEDSYSWETNLNTTFTLPSKTRIQLTGHYDGPEITAQGERSAHYMVNIGVRQDFFKRKLSTTLQVRDAFVTFKRESTTYGDNFYTFNKGYRKYPMIGITLTYRINNYKQERKGEDEDAIDVGAEGEGMGGE